MKNLKAAAQKEIHCFDPSWKEGTLPLSQDCVKQFFLAGAAYEREKAKGLVDVLNKALRQVNNRLYDPLDDEERAFLSGHKSLLVDALTKWREET